MNRSALLRVAGDAAIADRAMSGRTGRRVHCGADSLDAASRQGDSTIRCASRAADCDEVIPATAAVIATVATTHERIRPTSQITIPVTVY